MLQEGALLGLNEGGMCPTPLHELLDLSSFQEGAGRNQYQAQEHQAAAMRTAATITVATCLLSVIHSMHVDRYTTYALST